ncbi:MAG: Fe-S cluster assembly protein SufD [Vicinamibacterales bacterium]
MTGVEARGSYVEQFEEFSREHDRAADAWLRGRRREALARFEALGFPTTRMEDWRFTDVRPIAAMPFRLAATPPPAVAPETLAEFSFAEPTWPELVFVNGRYVPGLSRLGEPGRELTVRSLAEVLAGNGNHLSTHLGRIAPYEDNAFRALNTAFLADGALVTIPRGLEAGAPIHILFYSDTGAGGPLVSHPRVLIVAEEGSRAQVVETYAGEAGHSYFTNSVTEIAVGAGASIDYYRLERESLSAFHVSTVQARIARGATFSSHSVTLGGRLVRNDLNVSLEGEGVDCTLNGVYIASGTQLIDNHTVLDHAQPNCGSHQVYKGILDGRSKGVFNGKIFVRPDAQKTDAKQTNKVLLLSDEAQIDTKPQLEIFADDVKCTHGATVGQIDEEAMFYLRSRGIPREAARSLLIYAFASDVISRMALPQLRGRLDSLLLAQLPPAVY